MFFVVDNVFNREHNPDLIGNYYVIAPSYCAVIFVETNR